MESIKWTTPFCLYLHYQGVNRVVKIGARGQGNQQYKQDNWMDKYENNCFVAYWQKVQSYITTSLTIHHFSWKTGIKHEGIQEALDPPLPPSPPPSSPPLPPPAPPPLYFVLHSQLVHYGREDHEQVFLFITNTSLQ